MTSGFAFTEAVGFASPTDEMVLLDSGTAVPTGAFGAFQTPVLDVRAYNSIMVEVIYTGGAAAAFDPYTTRVRYFADQAAAIPVHTDSWDQFNTVTGANTGEVHFTDTVHGSWVQVTFSDPVSGRSSNFNYRVWGSYRQLPGVYMRQQLNYDGVLMRTNFNGVAAGAAADGAACIGFGFALLWARSGAGGGCTVDLYYGIDSTLITQLCQQLVIAAANTIGEKQIILPRRQARVRVTNNGAAASNIRVVIIEQLQGL